MRLTAKQLHELTGKKRISAQKKWFSDMLGVDVPVDRMGPILTIASLEKLFESRLGLRIAEFRIQSSHPTVRLIKSQ